MNETIELDGNTFEDCSFIGCTFRWNGEPFSIKNSMVQSGYRFETRNSQINDTIHLLRFLGALEQGFAASWANLPPPATETTNAETITGIGNLGEG